MTQERPPAWAAFTDGSCWVKDRVGGWAWIAFATSGEMAERSSGRVNTTISQMELWAPIDFLLWLNDQQGPSNVLIFSDSEYVVKGITDRTRARRLNQEIWRDLDFAVDTHLDVQFEHVRGHDDSYYNDRADELAGAARKNLQSDLRTDSRT